MTSMPGTGVVLRYVLVAFLAAALVSACGFRPRGSASLPADFQEIYVDAPVEISDEIALFLENGGASVIDSSGDADAVIKVGSQSYEERVVTVNAATGKGREFELLYTLNFSVRMRDGTMLIPAEHVVVRRRYIFDRTAVIGAQQNVESLQADMRRDAAQRIIRLTEAALGS
jgi:LPS-assembly lipoprotein